MTELPAAAVKDAREKARLLSQAGEVTLGEILTIDYSWEEIDFRVRPVNNLRMMADAAPTAKASLDVDIEPDDIQVSDTVTVVWEIR